MWGGERRLEFHRTPRVFCVLFKLLFCSMRVLPHFQDSGGFFIAVLEKRDWLPWQSKMKTKAAMASRPPPSASPGVTGASPGSQPGPSASPGAPDALTSEKDVDTGERMLQSYVEEHGLNQKPVTVDTSVGEINSKGCGSNGADPTPQGLSEQCDPATGAGLSPQKGCGTPDADPTPKPLSAEEERPSVAILGK